MKNELEIWIKSYLDAHSKGNGNLHDIELKVQEIRTLVMRKADHEGMKKGLAFLEGKITQVTYWLILVVPLLDRTRRRGRHDRQKGIQLSQLLQKGRNPQRKTRTQNELGQPQH